MVCWDDIASIGCGEIFGLSLSALEINKNLKKSEGMLQLYNTYSRVIKFTELPDPTDIWELEDLIGEGTYGDVYTAKHKVTGEKVAVKVLDSIHEMIEEIEQEFIILSEHGDHPNMPKFYGLFLKPGMDNQIWIVMELCGKGSVTHLSREVHHRGEKLDEMLIAHILHETLSVLAHLHSQKIIHRDVKGHNILINDSGEVKIIDFGVSAILENSAGRRKTSVGTPYWMAPEVIACERQLEYNYDNRCDIWSLGITAIELAESEPPLSDLHPMRALFKIPRNTSPGLQLPEKWSQNFKDFIHQCLVKDFEERPSAKELLQHPFITSLPRDPSVFKHRLKDLTAKMEPKIHEPDITTKKGRLKTHRKSKKEPLDTADDLTSLEILDEETIVSQLFHRYAQTKIYTYIGDILLAVNPFTPLTIYADEYAQRYMNAAKDDHPPHIFAVADQSYQMMMHNRKHQCIVISGESGAGKTESANLLVQQLTQLGKAPNRTLEDRILQVNPLMEAFGNAQTVINNNSSRFGKYLEMFFTSTGTVIGAKITEYLLEKSRVISQAKGEQNFHIFYYVHDGLAHDQDATYHLKDSAKYRYIDEYTSRTRDVASISVNRVKFKGIQHCFDIIGFQPEEVKAVYGIIASILHTGNVDFDEKASTHGGEACVITNMYLIEYVSKLLGINKNDLVEAFTTSAVVARGEVIIRDNSVPEAFDARDAMAKALYGRLFSWIVNRINSLLKPVSSLDTDSENNFIIGLLDIFGFENFPKNSFEQLCINIANEQIQYYFNQHIFAWEMAEYKSEGLEGIQVSFIDNHPLLDMFLMKPMGLLALLDEESHFPKATDASLVEKFHKNIQSKHYSRPKGSNITFYVDHYAGRVEYDAMGFLEKNRDRLPGDVVNMLRASENVVVKSLFQTHLTKTGNLASGSRGPTPATSALSSPFGSMSSINVQSYSSKQSTGYGGMGGSKYHGSSSSKYLYSIYSALGSASTSMTRIQQTVATYFRYSLMDLMSKMVAGTPHFVRCIRPNADNLPDQFDNEKVTVQLRYTGVLETTRIRREGYSHRIPFAEFIRRYHMLVFGHEEKVEYSRDCCFRMLERLKMDNWALGKSKVFLKYYHMEQLARVFEERNKKVVIIQSAVRMWQAQNKFLKLKWQREKAVVKIQSFARMVNARKGYMQSKKRRIQAAILVQKSVKGFMARKKVQPKIKEHRRQMEAAVVIQSKWRSFAAMKERKHLLAEKKRLDELLLVEQQRIEREKKQRQEEERRRQEEERKIAEEEARKEREEKEKRKHQKEVKFQTDSAIKIQREDEPWTAFRSHRAQKVAKELYKTKAMDQSRAAVLIQTYFRQWKCKSVYQQLQQYKSQKELQLIYFTQQVENYSQELSKTLDHTNFPIAVSHRKSAVIQREITPPPRPITPTPPDISDERLEHMRKLQKIKNFISGDQADYYKRVAGTRPGTSQIIQADVHVPPVHLNKRREMKGVIEPETAKYYNSFAETSGESTTDTNFNIEPDLNSNKEELLNENDVNDLTKRLEDECAQSIVHLWSKRQQVPVDDASIPESLSDSRHRQQPQIYFPPPPPLPPPDMPSTSKVPPTPPPPPPAPVSTKAKAPLPPAIKKTKAPPIPPLMLNGNSSPTSPLLPSDENSNVLQSKLKPVVQNGFKNGSAPKVQFQEKQIAQNGHANIVDEINNNEEFVKKRLRKTNVDWTTGTLRKKATHETQQFDFRSMLKKTGRLEKELETK
ncbi:myosin-IIIb-like isoform X1 [Mytilus galloprovincialis]|uniref:myosin-IIIb-like isoform X1 n=1 Tax=Mytilus galloprovincialis TaxID=29158 RepID=UPI003F7C3502